MKRIGVDAHVLTGKFQGSRTYLLNILRQLGRIDTVNRYILYSFDPAVTRALLPFPQFEHRPIGIHAGVPRLLLFWPWVQWRHRLDLLLTSYFAPLLYPQRQLVIVHDLLFESHPQYFGRLAGLRFRALVRLSARRSRLVLAVSETARAEIMQRYRLAEAQVRLVRGGIDPAAHRVDAARLPPAGQPYVLAVGRLEPRKNLPGLLRAFRLMRTPGVRLVVIGREDFAASGIAADLRGSERVTWLTDVTDADLPWYFRHAAVFAFPSFAEGFGLPVLEALVQGTPVVASDHAAMQEVGGAFARYFRADAMDADQRLADLLDDAIAHGRPGTRAALNAHIATLQWRQSAEAMLAIIAE